MIFLIIFIGIILLLNILLLIPVTFYGTLDNSRQMYIKYSFLKFNLLKKSKKKKSDGKKQAAAQKTNTAQKKEKVNITATIGKYKSIATVFLKSAKKLFKKVVIKNLYLNITVATGDSAQTAIEYGLICGGVYPTLTILEKVFTLKNKTVNITTDFNKNNTNAVIKAQVYIRPIFALTTLTALLLTYIKYNKE